jgi:hypothetical protein
MVSSRRTIFEHRMCQEVAEMALFGRDFFHGPTADLELLGPYTRVGCANLTTGVS